MFKVHAQSTPDFVRLVFRLYKEEKPFAIVRDDITDDPRLDGAETITLQETQAHGWVSEKLEPNWSDKPAQVVFSSGTEGRPKAIVLSYRNLADVIERLNEAMQVTSEIREYIGVPVTYAFGLGRARAVATAGGKAYLPERFDPAEISRMLREKKINAISAVPSLCRILLKSKALFADVAHELRWFEIGSQPMSAEEKLELRALFPNARIIQQYGLTEASRSTFLKVSEAGPDTLDSVGRIEGSVEVKLGENDAICLRGPHIALGQLTSPTEIAPFTDAEGWLVTKDRGEIRSGFLYFHGRLDDQINISGIKVSVDQLEARLREDAPGLSDHVAVAAVDDPLRGQVALLAVERAHEADLPALEAALGDALEFFGIARSEGYQTVVVDHLPLTGSGKVQRSALREAFLSSVKARPDQKGQDTVSDVLHRVFPRADISPQTTFQSLGGDSLSYVAVSLELESILGRLPEDWPSMSVAELEAQATKGSKITPVDTPTLLRALAIMLVVAGHFELLDYSGGGESALMVVAGMSFATFTLPSVFQSASVVPIAVLATRIALFTFGYSLLNFAVTGYGEWPAFFFIGNWISPDVEGAHWFIEVYLQLLCILMLLFSVKNVRRLAQEHTFWASVISAVVLVVIASVSDALVDTHDLFRRLPHLFAWMFVIGIAAWSAKSEVEKAIVTTVFLLGVWQFGDFHTIQLTFFPIAGLALIWLPSLRLPRIIASGARMVAGASLIIYVSHFQFAEVSTRVFGNSAALSWVFAIVGGVLVWRVYNPIDIWLARQLRTLFSRDEKLSPARSQHQ